MLKKPSILIVDDTPQNLDVLVELLGGKYRVLVSTSGVKALSMLKALKNIDLVLLDIMMPQMDGYEVITKMKSDDALKHIPVIFVTAKESTEDEQKGLALGAVDYITKPITPALVLERVKTHIALKKMQDELRSVNKYLSERLEHVQKENALVRDVNVFALASLAEARDNETGNHLVRTSGYVGILARQLKQSGAKVLSDEYIDLLMKAAPLHDIGKVGIADYILLKPGALTPEEFNIMKRHPLIGAKALDKALKQAYAWSQGKGWLDSFNVGKEQKEDAMDGFDVGEQSTSIGTEESSLLVDNTMKLLKKTFESQGTSALSLLEAAREIAIGHHEKWDGSGYPYGLSGEQIPFAARLMALADVFDALTTKRVYKPAFSFDKAHEIIMAGSGKHFDPMIVQAYEQSREEFITLAKAYWDE